MHWPPFKLDGTIYDLAHLHPETVDYVKPAKGDDPERVYHVNVTYSLHCFTHEPEDGEVVDPAMWCTDGRERRVFDLQRWQLSRLLPGIIRDLMQQKCFHGGNRNFLTIFIPNPADKAVLKYEVYFQVSRASQPKGYLNLYVQSAYVREQRADEGKRRHNPPIRFAFILYNTLHGVAIKIPK